MNKLKVLGFAVSILGAGVSVLSDTLNKKEQDAKIAEAVSKAVSELNNK